MYIRRTAVVAMAAVTTAALTLGGCDDGRPVTEGSGGKGRPRPMSTAEGAFDVEKAVRDADPTPYSAHMESDSFVGGKVTMSISGRFNLNSRGGATARVHSGDGMPADQAVDEDVVMTAKSIYRKDLTHGVDSPWQEETNDGRQMGNEYANYARLMLGLGPKARKGMERLGGVPVYRLSAALSNDQITAADPAAGEKVRAIQKGAKIPCDLLINKDGRVVRMEQWLGRTTAAHTVITMTDMLPGTYKVTPPTDAIPASPDPDPDPDPEPNPARDA
ncbi:hypothetical protein [Streptomyces syringium]|uniref:hypothetical protein n=1 Tax=Streptomyces syringium TaxID=76729 RepID=UPI0037D41F1D